VFKRAMHGLEFIIIFFADFFLKSPKLNFCGLFFKKSKIDCNPSVKVSIPQ
jgi:hypothetical protein